jgi:hypothetical protein
MVRCAVGNVDLVLLGGCTSMFKSLLWGPALGEMYRMEFVDLVLLGGCTSVCKSLLGFSSLMFLFGVVAFVYEVIPWRYVRSGSYMLAVVVILQTLYLEWR